MYVAVAEKLGVFAEPEQLTLKFSPEQVKIIVLASDGVFDVMSNQQVIDLCYQHQQDPMQACRAVVARSHKEWLINDECEEGDDAANYDDMTIICIFFDDDEVASGAAAANADKDDIQLPATASQPEPQQKRVRHKQKTLRNLEEMGLE